MKLILLFIGCITASMLAGCTMSAPSMLSGIGGGGKSGNFESSNATGEPALTTGSIVPARNEGDVVDLPDSSVHLGRSAVTQRRSVDDYGNEELSAEERHRRELVNRGDLEEGQPLPAQ